MSIPATQEVTELLLKWSESDREALEQLTPVIYNELHRIARRYMNRERSDHTLQASAPVNEADVRLINRKTARWENRAHFFGVSAQLMRRILVDFARQRPRFGGQTAPHISIDENLTVGMGQGDDLVALDNALSSLAKIDERKSRIVEMRFFGGLSNEEIAEVLQISTVTVIREWNKAKAWLYRELSHRP